jgi:spore coat protein D
MGHKRWNHPDEFILGRRHKNRGNDVAGARDNHKGKNDVETIVSPTETLVSPTTNERTIRKIHPTHVKHVNKNITRVENYYPVTNSREDIDFVEEYDCGSDLNNPNCRRVDSCHNDCNCHY